MALPSTGPEAIAMVRASQKMSDAARPFAREIEWKAEWTDGRWYVVGLFESEWGVKFVQDASIRAGVVYAYIDYSSRPPLDWVRKQASDWGLATLYTRLSQADAHACPHV